MFSREQKVGIFFLGGVVLFAAFVELTVGTGFFRRSYPLHAEYLDVQGLASGAPVWVAGVRAGTVSSLTLTRDRVRVELSMDRHIEVHADATARLDFQALSGTRFVAIERGSPEAPVLEAGGSIPTEEPAGISAMVSELSALATSVRDLADSLNENQDRLLATVGAMLEENRESLHGTIAGLDAITRRLDEGEGTLGKLLTDATLYDRAVATLDALELTFGDIRAITAPIAAGEGPVGRLLHDEAMFDEIRETVASVNVAARDLEDVTGQILRGENTVGRMLVDDELYEEAREALTGVSRATQSIEDQAPVSVLGTLLGVLF